MRSRCGLLAVLTGVACGGPLPDLGDATRDLTEDLPVFPGAMGFGSHTVAGRGGQVLVVTTLAADGEGSLSEALATPGPRVVLFEVGGVIELTENLQLTEPFVTVAGQTAPDPGITLDGAGLVVTTHDVLVQHLAIRPGGADEGPGGKVRDALQVIGEPSGNRDVYNVVIDHVSLSWAVDETFSTWYPGVRDVTITSSILGEGLRDSVHPEGEHSMGLLVGDHTRRFSAIGNVLAYNNARNPLAKGDTTSLFANNLVFDPGSPPVAMADPEGSGPSWLTVVDSVFVAGVDTPDDTPIVFVDRSTKPESQLYVAGASTFDAESVRIASDRDAAILADAPPVWVTPLELLPTTELEVQLLRSAGSRPWARNPVDQRILTQILRREGRIIDSESEVGGLGKVPSTRHDLTLPPDPEQVGDDGYTALEHWLWSFDPATAEG